MSLLPRLDEIVPTGEKHHSCNYSIQALLTNIGYINYFEAECVSMPMVKVCPKCGKYRNVGRIPVPVNSATIQKYGIDIANNIKIKQKYIIKLDFISTTLDILKYVTGTIEILNEITFVSENQVQNTNYNKEIINNETMHEIISKWNEYRKLDFKFIGYDTNGNPKYVYNENVINDGVEIQLIYTKTIID